MIWFSFFFFNDTATTEIYTLSLHDALPIWRYTTIEESRRWAPLASGPKAGFRSCTSREEQWPSRRALLQYSRTDHPRRDRKSTRLNSSHANISYAVLCLKKKNTRYKTIDRS